MADGERNEKLMGKIPSSVFILYAKAQKRKILSLKKQKILFTQGGS